MRVAASRISAAVSIGLMAVFVAACGEPKPSPTSLADLRLACLQSPEDECRQLANEAVSRVHGPGTVASVMVEAFGCEIRPCPPERGALTHAFIWVELADPGAVRTFVVGVDDGAAPSMQNGVDAPFVTHGASSTGTAGEGQFTTGRCGIINPIDFDGSLWDPVGVIAANRDATTTAHGRIDRPDPNTARFNADSGFVVDLLRRAGAKTYWVCN